MRYPHTTPRAWCEFNNYNSAAEKAQPNSNKIKKRYPSRIGYTTMRIIIASKEM